MSQRVVGIDIGGTKIAAALADPHGKLSEQRQVPTPQTGGEQIVQAVRVLVEELGGLAQTAGQQVVGIGIGSAGVLDAVGRVVSATDLIPDWAGTDLAGVLAQFTGLPVRALNDVHATALAEAQYGAARGAGDAVVVAVGTGVGGAIVRHGEVILGRGGMAGGFGHIPVPSELLNQLVDALPTALAQRASRQPRVCACGKPGHLEAYASGPAMEQTYLELSGISRGLREIAPLAQRGDHAAAAALSWGARALGHGLGVLNSVLDPHLVVIGGGVSALLAQLHPDLTQQMLESGFSDRLQPPVVAAELGAAAGLAGAAVLGWQAASAS